MKRTNKIITVIGALLIAAVVLGGLGTSSADAKEDENSVTTDSVTAENSEALLSTASDEVASGTCGDDIAWVLTEDGTLTLSGTGEMYDYSSGSSPWYSYRSSITKIIVGDNITSIGTAAFYYCSYVTECELPSSLITIDDYAFNRCKSLSSIELPSSLTSIGNLAFYNCISITSVNLDELELLTSLGEAAFAYCTSLESVEIPSGITVVDYNTFGGCSSLSSITLPDGLIEIGVYAFSGAAIEDIVIPDSVTIISGEAFRNCSNLSSVTLSSNWTSIGDGTLSPFYGCSSLTSIDIPEGMEIIPDEAFEFMFSLESITIPDSVTEIGYLAFDYCDSLTEIVLPSSLEVIGDYAFSDCKSLTEINLPSSLTTLGCGAFDCCYSLESIEIPSGITYIEEYTFTNCSSLKAVTLSETITSIGAYAFYSCTSLESIVIPDSVTDIGYSAFGYCSSLTDVTLSKNWSTVSQPSANSKVYGSPFCYTGSLTVIDIPEGMQTIPAYAFYNCTSLEQINIPEGVTTIEKDAFCNCTSLNGVELPASITGISEYAFAYCSSLESIEIPEGMTTIENYTFCDCSSLNEVVLPETIILIDSMSFYNCTSLESIVVPDSVTTIGDRAFGGCSALSEVSLSKNWVSDENSYYSPFYGCDKLTSIDIPDGMETIPDYAFKETSLEYVFMPESVIAIGTGAFQSCTALSDIEFSASIMTIGSYAFYGCTSLEQIDIPESVTTIGESAFRKCTSLNDIELPASITEIGECAFYYCSSLESIVVPPEITSIESETFSCCFSLTNISLPEKLTTVGDEAFANCTSLTGIDLPSSLTSIGDYAFESCTSLTGIDLPSSLTSIGDYAFYCCSSLKEVDFPSSLSTIGSYAFRLCTSLEEIELPSSLTSLYNYTFYNCTSLSSVVLPENLTYIGEYCFAYTAVNNITFPETLTKIAAYAFYNCESLEAVDLPDSVTTLGAGAFSSCSNLSSLTLSCNWTTVDTNPYRYKGPFAYCDLLTTITLPDGMTSIPDYAFYLNTQLVNIEIPDSVTSIGEYAFGYCDFLSFFLNDTNVKSIGDYAFYECDQMTTIYYSDSLTTIGDYAFENCESLTEAYIPDTVRSIGTYAYYGCTGITVCSISSKIKSIPVSLFENCSSLETVIIPSSVTKIYGYAFYGCSSISDVYYGGDEDSWDSINIYSGNGYLTNASIHYTDDYSSSDEYFVIGVDTNRFRNNSLYFGSNYSTEYFDQLLELNEGKISYYVIQEKYNSAFTGSCNGIAISEILACEGELTDLLGDSDYYDLGTPLENDTLRDIINYYHLAQYAVNYTSETYNTTLKQILNSGDSLSEYLELMVAEAAASDAQGTPFLFTYLFDDDGEEDGHVGVVCGLDTDDDLNYVLKIFDCNSYKKIDTYEYAGEYLYMTISSDYSSFTFENANGVQLDECWIGLRFLGSSDLEEADWNILTNSDSSQNSSAVAAASNDDEGTVDLMFSAFDEFTLTSSEGETLYYDGETYGGDLTVYDMELIYDDEIQISLTIDQCESYAFTDLGESFSASIMIDGTYYTSTAVGADEMIFSIDSGIEINGESSYTFDAGTSMSLSLSELVLISGETTGTTTIQISDEGLEFETEGDCGDVVLETYDGSSYKNVEISEIVSELTVYEDENDDLIIKVNDETEYTVVTDISGAAVELSADSYEYTGSEIEPAITVVFDETSLVLNSDYEVSYSNNIDVGTASITVKGVGYYTGEVTAAFEITARSIEDAAVTLNYDSYDYNGIAIEPTLTVTLDDVELVEGTDYTVSYADNTDAGTATVTVTGVGNYTGTAGKTFTINARSIEDASISLSTTSYAYNGDAKEPAPTVTLNDVELVEGTDYTVSYADNTNAGTATVTITGIGNYTGTAEKTFTIEARSIEDASITLSTTSYTYDGGAKEPTPTVTLDDVELVEGTDYTVSYANNTNAGTATVTVTGVGNYTGTVDKTFTIEARSIEVASITLSTASYTYNGSARKPTPTVTVDDAELVEGTDYTVSYADNTNAGTATIKVTGIGNYTGTVEKTFTINARSIEDASITLSTTSYTYDGNARKPTPTVTIDDTELVEGTDYTVSYADNTNAGTATVTVTGIGNYTGTAEKTFTIEARSIENASVSLSSSSYTYDGSAKKPTPTVTLNDMELVKGTNYTVSYTDNTDAGTATVTITGIGNYTGTVEAEFVIEAQKLSSSNVSLSFTSKTYTGSAFSPTVTVKNSAGTTLTKGTDYTVTTPSGRKNAGTYTYTIKGTGNYSGTVTKKLTITAQSLSSSNVSLSYTSKTYTGSAFSPTVTVKNSAGTTLTKGTDYTVTTPSGRKNAGTYTYTIKGTGSYKGTITKTLTIKPVSIKTSSSAYVSCTLSKTSYTYSGSARKPSVTLKVKVNGKTKTLSKSSSSGYTVSYKNNTKIGKATVTITGTGNYTGTITKTFTIKPKQGTISNLKSSAKKKMTVKWKTVSGSVTKYQVRYRVKGTSKWTTKTYSSSTKSKTITGLKSGKTYQVQVRAYKTVSGTKYYGSWSSTKTVKVK